MQVGIFQKKYSERIDNDYRTLIGNIIKITGSIQNKIIAVSSLYPNEGKTTTITNLALFLARDGFKTLLIDADLRMPSLQRLFETKTKFGLYDFCTGICSDNECIVRDIVSNLDIITAGNHKTITDEMLSLNFQTNRINSIKSDYDFILIDMPPIKLYKDIVCFKKIIQGIIFVSKKEMQVCSDEITNCLEWLKIENIEVIGYVINSV